jgi:hypothetical protein
MYERIRSSVHSACAMLETALPVTSHYLSTDFVRITDATSARERRRFSAASRKRMAEARRQRWAALKGKAAPSAVTTSVTSAGAAKKAATNQEAKSSDQEGNR